MSIGVHPWFFKFHCGGWVEIVLGDGWLAGVARVVGLGERLGLIHNHKGVQHGLRSRDASVVLPRGAMLRAPREEKAGSGEQTDDYEISDAYFSCWLPATLTNLKIIS